MKKLLLMGALVLVAGTLNTKADQTGLHVIHDLRNERGQLCMDGHYHDGSGAGSSRKAAEAAAAASWASFVSLEYGTDWAHHAYAHSSTMTCKPQASTWSCETSARPCLRQAGAARHAAKPAAQPAKTVHAHSRHHVKLAKAEQ